MIQWSSMIHYHSSSSLPGSRSNYCSRCQASSSHGGVASSCRTQIEAGTTGQQHGRYSMDMPGGHTMTCPWKTDTWWYLSVEDLLQLGMSILAVEYPMVRTTWDQSSTACCIVSSTKWLSACSLMQNLKFRAILWPRWFAGQTKSLSRSLSNYCCSAAVTDNSWLMWFSIEIL